MNLLRKTWNLARVFAGYRRRAEVLGVMPVRLWIESASACNLKCVMCPNKIMAAGERGLMKIELFRKVIDEARDFVHDVYLHHRGEPLLNPAIFDMIAYARAAGIRTRFHTNGTLLDEEKSKRLLAAGPDLVSFSVDGFSKEAYEAVRGGAVFEETVANITRLLELRRDARLRRPYIVVERIVFRKPPPGETPDTIAELTGRFNAAGIDEVIAKEEYFWAEAGAQPQGGQRSYGRCTFPWYAMVICRDGTVTPCPQDFHAFLKMGDVNHASLREIWNGPQFRDLRRRFNADVESLTLCRDCDRLKRKTMGGIPLQYMATFLTDHLVGYNRLRRLLGTAERN